MQCPHCRYLKFYIFHVNFTGMCIANVGIIQKLAVDNDNDFVEWRSDTVTDTYSDLILIM